MELRHLRYFAAVAETKNFSKAAQVVNVTQPAISRTIKDLEEELGVDLFIRHPSGLLLTENGRMFLRSSHRILECADTAIRQAHFSRHLNDVPRLRVGIDASCSAPWLFKALLAFGSSFPRVELSISDGRADQMIHRLRAGDLDLCLIPSADSEVPVDVEAETITKSRVQLVVSIEHRFAQAPYIDLSQLKDEPLVLCDDPNHAEMKQAALVACRRAGFQPPQIIRASSHFSMLALVAAKRGYGMHTEDSDLSSGTAVVRQVPLMRAAFSTRSMAFWMRGTECESRDSFLSILRSSVEKRWPLSEGPVGLERLSPDAARPAQSMRRSMGGL